MFDGIVGILLHSLPVFECLEQSWDAFIRADCSRQAELPLQRVGRLPVLSVPGAPRISRRRPSPTAQRDRDRVAHLPPTRRIEEPEEVPRPFDRDQLHGIALRDGALDERTRIVIRAVLVLRPVDEEHRRLPGSDQAQGRIVGQGPVTRDHPTEVAVLARAARVGARPRHDGRGRIPPLGRCWRRRQRLLDASCAQKQGQRRAGREASDPDTLGIDKVAGGVSGYPRISRRGVRYLLERPRVEPISVRYSTATTVTPFWRSALTTPGECHHVPVAPEPPWNHNIAGRSVLESIRSA